MRVLGISSAYGGCSLAYCNDGQVIGRRGIDANHGLPAALPALCSALLSLQGAAPEAIGVCVGPGSFTGIRAGLAFASGLGLALGVPVCGVTASAALRRACAPPGRDLWIAIEARRGRLFLDRGAGLESRNCGDLPLPAGPVAIAGNAAKHVAASLAARGADVMLTNAVLPASDWIAAIAQEQMNGMSPRQAAEPLYVDAPEAKSPAASPRAVFAP